MPSEPAGRALAAAGAMREALDAARPAPLEAGWASAPLDLRAGEPLAGYGARRGAASTGTDDPLYARALYLRSGTTEVAIVTADVLLIHERVARETRRLCAARGLGPASVYFTATHTHCGPGGWGPHIVEQAVCGRFDPDAAPRLARVLASAVLAARATVRPAEWTWIESAAPEHLRNRTTAEPPPDSALDALAVRRVDDGTIGVFAIFGAHATCLGPGMRRFSADYPGAFVRRLEAAGIAFAAFGAGAMGSQSPAGKTDGPDRAEEIGVALSGRLLEGIRSASWKRDAPLASARCEVPLPDLQVRIARNVRLAPWLTASLHGPEAAFHLLRIDDHRLAGLPVEFSALLSGPLRDEARRAGVELCVTLFNGDYAGYVLPPRAYDGPSYEALSDLLGPWSGDYFAELIRRGVGCGHGGSATSTR